MKLFIDEQVQGYSKEFTTAGEMLEELNKVVDDKTCQVVVIKRKEDKSRNELPTQGKQSDSEMATENTAEVFSELVEHGSVSGVFQS